jgi:hypothetical protein
MGNVSASDGGCWYCETDEGEMPFSFDFDCWLHIDCLRARLNSHPNDIEALIFAREFHEALGLTLVEVQKRIDREVHDVFMDYQLRVPAIR